MACVLYQRLNKKIKKQRERHLPAPNEHTFVNINIPEYIQKNSPFTKYHIFQVFLK